MFGTNSETSAIVRGEVDNAPTARNPDDDHQGNSDVDPKNPGYGGQQPLRRMSPIRPSGLWPLARCFSTDQSDEAKLAFPSNPIPKCQTMECVLPIVGARWNAIFAALLSSALLRNALSKLLLKMPLWENGTRAGRLWSYLESVNTILAKCRGKRQPKLGLIRRRYIVISLPMTLDMTSISLIQPTIGSVSDVEVVFDTSSDPSILMAFLASGGGFRSLFPNPSHYLPPFHDDDDVVSPAKSQRGSPSTAINLRHGQSVVSGGLPQVWFPPST
uniref:Uncharacterized protein n=1 Tax=Panagrellus redivivus TaxID=6233 RepID=A0A7E4ZR30_PANRE